MQRPGWCRRTQFIEGHAAQGVTDRRIDAPPVVLDAAPRLVMALPGMHTAFGHADRSLDRGDDIQHRNIGCGARQPITAVDPTT